MEPEIYCPVRKITEKLTGVQVTFVFPACMEPEIYCPVRKIIEKLTGVQVTKIFPACMEPEIYCPVRKINGLFHSFIQFIRITVSLVKDTL
jgi:hypothetical protein